MSSEIMHEEGRRLADVAQVLRNNGMPQETINMVLAARCGLPMQKIDGKSPCFAWVDADKPPMATGQESGDELFARLRDEVVMIIQELPLSIGLRVIGAAMREFAAPFGATVSWSLNSPEEETHLL